jgi:hypothetical protein
MNRKTHGPRFVAPFLLAFAVMAFGASPAQAGEFRINGKTMVSQGIKEETFSGTGESLEISIPPANARIICADSTFSGSMLQNGVIHKVTNWLGCFYPDHPGCTVYPTLLDRTFGTNAGRITTRTLTQVALLGSPTKYYLEEEGAPISTIFHNEECSLPEEVEIKGTLDFEMPTASSELVSQTMNAAGEKIEKELKTQLKYGAWSALLVGGTEKMELSGKSKGLKWGAE